MGNTQARPFPKIGEILRAGFATFRENALLILGVVIGVGFVGELLAPASEEFSVENLSWRFALDVVLRMVITFGQGLIVTLAALHVSLAAAKGEKIDVGSLFDRVYVTFLPVLVLGGVAGSAVALGFLALVIPGLVLLVRWTFATVSLIDGGLSPVAAMRRSAALVEGRWWRVAGLMGAVFVVNLLVAGVLLLVLAVVGLLPNLADATSNPYLSGLSSAFTAMCIGRVYVNLVELDSPKSPSALPADPPSPVSVPIEGDGAWR